MTVLQVEGLKKRLGGVDILKGVDFDLQEGETLAVIGASGSGKTTMLRCLTALERPDGGRVAVRGRTVQDGTVKQVSRRDRLRFGLVFQSFNLFPQYTALRNVTLARELLLKEEGVPRQQRKELARREALELLDRMGLADRADYYPSQLSGGQQQRVAIARALALKPDILCFDEPTSALDPELTAEVLRVIRRLAEERTTMIVVTHEMDFAREAADRVMFMDGGAVVECGPAREVLDNPSAERTRQFLKGLT